MSDDPFNAEFGDWSDTDVAETIRRIERALQPDLGYLMSERAVASETLRLGRLKRERTRRWVASQKGAR